MAERIREIEARFDLRSAIADFRQSLDEVPDSAALAHRGHNNPPELILDNALSEPITIVWVALADIEREAEADEPDKSRIEKALRTVRDWFVKTLRYLGQRAVDLAIDETIRWAVKVGGVYLLFNPSALQRRHRRCDPLDEPSAIRQCRTQGFGLRGSQGVTDGAAIQALVDRFAGQDDHCLYSAERLLAAPRSGKDHLAPSTAVRVRRGLWAGATRVGLRKDANAAVHPR